HRHRHSLDSHSPVGRDQKRDPPRNFALPPPKWLVRSQIRPDGAPVGYRGVIRFDPALNFTRHRLLHFAEPLVDLQQVFTMRIASAPRNPVDARAILGSSRKMIRPKIVDRPKRDAFLARGHVACQNLLPPRMDLVSLPFERYFIPVQEHARVETLSFHQTLERVRLIAIPFIQFAVSHHQIVFERDKEARCSRIPLASRALRTSCGMSPSSAPTRSESAPLPVPTRIGCPVACTFRISSATACSFS